MQDRKKVRVTVTGADGHEDAISLTTQGVFWEQDDVWYLKYRETNPEDMVSTETMLQCQGGRVTVSRTGTILSTLIFEEKETFVGQYDTPAGSFQLRVFAASVDVKRRGLMGHIRIVYQISMSTAFSQGEETATRTLDVRFAPCRQS